MTMDTDPIPPPTSMTSAPSRSEEKSKPGQVTSGLGQNHLFIMTTSVKETHLSIERQGAVTWSERP